LTELSKLSQQIKAAGKKQEPDAAAVPELMATTNDPQEDCEEPPPRNCRGWRHHSDGLVHANVVGVGQLPDDLKAQMPKWITARTVARLPDESTGGENGPCCICPQCGLSFYTPNDYWGHIPTCVVPTGGAACVQNVECTGDTHFDPDPHVCMCRPGRISSSSSELVVLGATGGSSSAPVAIASSSSP
jgi:hypothetical protein